MHPSIRRRFALLALVAIAPIAVFAAGAPPEPIPLNKEGVVKLKIRDANALQVVESIVYIGNYDFVTKGKIDEPVSVNLSGVSIEDALDTITQTVGLEYKVQGRIITLFGKDADSSYTLTYKFKTANVSAPGGPGAVILALVEGKEETLALGEQAAGGGGGGGGLPAAGGAAIPSGGGGGTQQGSGKVIIDGLNNQIVVTAKPSVHRKIANLIGELDKPTSVREGRRARIFELRYITPAFFSKAIKFEIPGFDDRQVLLFTDSSPAGGAGGAAPAGGGAAPAAGGAAGGGAAGGAGAAEMESNLKRVIVNESEANLNKIENLLKAIDRSPRQVFVDVKLIDVTHDTSDQFGAQFRQVITQNGSSSPVAELFSNNSASSSNPFKLKVGTLGPEQFEMLMDFLESNTQSNLLSNPKLTVVDGKPAVTELITREPYGETTVNQGVSQTTVKFLDVGISLKFTPTIYQDNFIKISLQPSVSDAPSTVTIGGNPIPVENKTSADTTVIVKDGHTVIMGGIMRANEQKDFQTWPVIGHLPLIGRLFHNHKNATQKKELIITLTPKIVDKNDFNMTSHSRGVDQGQLKYFFDDAQQVMNRIVFIDQVVDY